MSPPWPISANSRLPIRSPASTRGSTRSNVVASENIPHDGMPTTGRPSQLAIQSRLPGCAGAPWRSMRAPTRARAPNTGSSGSSALAPATISTSTPAACSSFSSFATSETAGPAYRMGKRRPPNQSIFARNDFSNRARCLSSRLSRATAPTVNGRNPSTATSPLTSPPSRSMVSIVVPAMTRGVILHRATTSPGSTGSPWKSVYTEMPSSAFARRSASARTRNRPPRAAGARGLDLGQHGERDLGRRLGPDVEADRDVHATEQLPGHAVLDHEVQDRVGTPRGAEHADVAERLLERVLEHRDVVLVIVRDQHERGGGDEGIGPDQL